MEREELLNQINKNNEELNSLGRQKRELEDDFEAICSFMDKSDKQAAGLYQNLQRRKNRLNGLSDLINVSKTAKKYRDVMNDMLMGKEYSEVKSDLDNMHKTLDTEKRRLVEELNNIDNKIKQIKCSTNRLQLQADSLQEV